MPETDMTSPMPASGVFTTQTRFPRAAFNEPPKVFARLMWFDTSGNFIAYADEGPKSVEVAPPLPDPKSVTPDQNAQLRSSIQVGGITYSFAQPTLSGQYAGGRWWVRSPVTITAISPNSVRSGDRWMHGVEVNWGHDQGATDNDRQGADSEPHRRSDGTATANTIPYQHDRNRDPAIRGAMIFNSGQEGSVVKWRSDPSAPGTRRYKISEIQVLTVVASAPPAGALYPGYASSRAKVTGLTDGDVNLALLPNHAFPTAQGIPSTYQQVLAKARRVYQHGNLRAFKQNINVWPEQQYTYSVETSEILLWLLSNWINASQKKALALAFIENGFDIYERIKSGAKYELSGRLAPITFAAIMLNHADMLAHIDYTNTDVHRAGYKARTDQTPPWPLAGPLFQEFLQIRYVDQWRINNPPNARVNNSHPFPLPYPQSMLGRPEWGIEAWTRPSTDDYWLGGTYRSNNSGHQWQTGLGLQLLPGARQAIKHPAFFDYLDYLKNRMWQRPDREGPNRPQPWFKPIWDAFRVRGGPIYPHVCPTNRPGY